MLRFANIEMLWLLLLIPVMAAGYIYATRRKRRQLLELGDKSLVKELMPDASHGRPTAKFILLMSALVLLIIAAARPQAGQKSETVKRQGIEVMIALDVSNSMMAEDVAPNRLDRAKQMLSKMIDKMQDDKVGLVVFAGEAYTQLPITCDYVSAKMFLNNITTDLVPTQGTAIGSAIRTSVRSFGSEQSEAGRAIILLTDAENHEDDAVAAAKEAQEKGIQVFVVGVGKPDGSPIPIPGTGTFRKDRQGQVVVSRLNEQAGKEIAQAGNGMYVRCDNSNTAMRALQQELNKIATADIETQLYTDYQEQYQSFLLVALLLLIVEFFLLARKNRTLIRLDIFKERMPMKAVVLLLLALPATVFAQKEAGNIRSGNRHYESERYTDAEVDYRRGLDKNQDSFEAHYNLGNALFRQDKYDEAAREYTKAMQLMENKKEKAKAQDTLRLAHSYHNLGNSYYGQQRFQEAIRAYKQSLRLNPKDNDTRYNLIKAMQMQEQQQQQQEQQQDQQQSQEQQQEQQEQQAQEQQAEEQQAQEAQAEESDEQMDKETAEQILQALEQDEQDTQEKVQQQKGGKKKRVEKDW